MPITIVLLLSFTIDKAILADAFAGHPPGPTPAAHPGNLTP